MANYEGLVATRKDNEKVEVLIRPSSEGILGASERINQQVCHCAAEGSTVKIEAINAARAEVGDWVVLHRDTKVLFRNAVLLVGIPLIGLLVGLIILHARTGFENISALSIIIAAVPFSASVLIVLAGFKKIYKPSVPVVTGVLKKAPELAAGNVDFCPAASNPSCCESWRMTC